MSPHTSQEISDLKIFLNASAGHSKRCGGPHVTREPRVFATSTLQPKPYPLAKIPLNEGQR